jgi:hypothetical protein
VLTYIWTVYGSRDLEEVRADIDRQMWLLASTGYPVDEVTNIENDVEYNYYYSIYSHIKRHMQNKI